MTTPDRGIILGRQNGVLGKEPKINQYDAIQIPLLGRKSLQTETGLRPLDRELVRGAINFVNSLPLELRQALSVPGETLKQQVRDLLESLPYPRDDQKTPANESLRSYRGHLGEVLGKLEKPGEEALRATKICLKSGEEKTLWEQLVTGLNFASRWFIGFKTGINCTERTEEGNWKPIEIVKNSN